MPERPFLKPLPARECPLFCVFYAEFDIVVGPKVCFQSPRDFMHQDIEVSTLEIEDCLDRTFRELLPHDGDTPKMNRKMSSASNMRRDDGDFLSIFDSTSEYIITGNELAGKMINLSTHNVHILTLPEVIFDERYERNNLLFCVGFVLRRSEDPRPFRPLLSKFAMALRSTETESECLTHPTKRPLLQGTLDNLLLSLNSGESNLLLNPANSLHLKLFQPPKPPALPVPDYAVPILLRRDWQVQMYDWDLAINWVVLHIDGVNNTKSISVKTEVDLEMVRACLRVLKHHGVIALVDMFFYSNRYEATERAAALLAGNEPKLLQEALEFSKRNKAELDSSMGELPENCAMDNLSSSLTTTPASFAIAPPSSSFPPRRTAGSNRSAGSFAPSPEIIPSVFKRKEHRKFKAVLAEWYASLDRNASFGDLLVDKLDADESTGLGEDHRRGLYRSESSGSEPPDSTKNADSRTRNATDWREAFNYFDHRRVVMFGVVHGLIRRVHSFPFAVGNFPDSHQKSLRAMHHDDTTPRAGTSCLNRTTSHRKSDATQDANDKEMLAAKVASRMNGKVCDDELVCEFELALEELTDLVKSHRIKHVLPLYSTGPEY
jgi:nitrogen permease regulator 2-like protein